MNKYGEEASQGTFIHMLLVSPTWYCRKIHKAKVRHRRDSSRSLKETPFPVDSPISACLRLLQSGQKNLRKTLSHLFKQDNRTDQQ